MVTFRTHNSDLRRSAVPSICSKNRRVDRAVAATDALIDFMDTMFEGMESGIDPGLLDCSIEPLFDT
jgi:hypothetical protein